VQRELFMNRHLFSISILMSFFLFTGMTTEPNPVDIVRKANDLLRFTTSEAELDIQIIRPRWQKSMSMKTWTKGTDYAMTLITAPAKEAGTVYLKKKNELWNWLPKVKKTIKLPGSMLGQNFMGTDLTASDVWSNSNIESEFDHKLIGKEMQGGQMCYKIESVTHEDSDIIWGKIISWIDVKNFIQMKVEFYDEDMDLANTFLASQVKNMAGKMRATKLEVIPANKKGQKTIVSYRSLKVDHAIPTEFFTVENMKKVN
jgi:hypothetical protein